MIGENPELPVHPLFLSKQKSRSRDFTRLETTPGNSHEDAVDLYGLTRVKLIWHSKGFERQDTPDSVDELDSEIDFFTATDLLHSDNELSLT